MCEDRVCQGYRVIKSQRVKTVEIVLAHNPLAVSPYVTWKAYAHTQFKDFAYGHYFIRRSQAEKDFERRVADAREDFCPHFPQHKKPGQDTPER